MDMEYNFEVTVVVPELDYRSRPYQVMATREGLAKTKAMVLAFHDGLALQGELVEYEVA